VWCPRHTIQFFNHGYTEYSEKALELLDISISSLEWKNFMLKQGLWLKVRRLPGKVKGTGIATSYLICYRNRKIREDSMPIYEYKATAEGCNYCRDGFEVRQSIDAGPLTECPKCQAPVKRLLSQFHACVVETSNEVAETERKLRDYEKEGMWSHAAELADKTGLEDRAKEDYKRAGHEI